MPEFLRSAACLCLLLLAGAAHAQVVVRDDAGNQLTLAKPAQRIIALAPHITELLFAAGAGHKVVGAMNFSDYPEAAKQIPLIGNNSQLDLERVIALKPDLLIAWKSGNTARQLEQVSRLGIPVFYSEPAKLDDVANSLLRFGQLAGTAAAAQAAAADYRKQVAALGARYGKRAPVRVFYQIWDKPLYTLNGQHIVSDAISLCGGENIFAGLKVIAPAVSIEAVLQEDPEVIFGGDQHDPEDAGINIWKQYKSMRAVRGGNLFVLGGERMTRPTPRMVQGMADMCERLEQARQRRVRK